MHEGAICREIVNIITYQASIHDIEKVYEIVIQVGPYSCIHEGQLNFYFEMLRKGTCMEDAYISIEKDDSLIGPSQMYVKTFRGE